MPTDKVTLVNQKAMRRKYGRNGWRLLQGSIDALIAADRQRRIGSRLVAMDSVVEMRRLQAEAVSDAEDPAQNKQAVDAVCRALQPDYILFLGAPDTLPQQPLQNPLLLDGDDPDDQVASDLPYACEAPFGLHIEDYKAPTRVVGRLPDINGLHDPQYLVQLLKKAARWRRSSAKIYNRCFAITAEVWRGSTRRSVRNLFGYLSGLCYSPPRGPEWRQAEIAPRSHFINLHGAPDDPHFYGQQGQDFPTAHSASLLAGKISTGTVVAAECCYGAELYNPADTGSVSGIANTYLAEGAYGFFGSTTVAYGPADGNDAADLICQYFMRAVLQGASLGRAVLQARQQYVARTAPLSPVDLKTLGQFYLLGDPSIHPVSVAAETRFRSRLRDPKFSRGDRRRALIRKAGELAVGTACSRSLPDGEADRWMQKQLRTWFVDQGLKPSGKAFTFTVHGAPAPVQPRSLAAGRRAQGGGSFVLAFSENQRSGTPRGPSSRVLVVAETAGRQIHRLNTYYAR